MNDGEVEICADITVVIVSTHTHVTEEKDKQKKCSLLGDLGLMFSN